MDIHTSARAFVVTEFFVLLFGFRRLPSDVRPVYINNIEVETKVIQIFRGIYIEGNLKSDD